MAHNSLSPILQLQYKLFPIFMFFVQQFDKETSTPIKKLL